MSSPIEPSVASALPGYAPSAAPEQPSARWTNPRVAGRIPELDGVRGFAIIAVVVFHYFVQSTHLPVSAATQTALFAPLRLLVTAIDSFFVLSGFLIGGILLDAKQSTNYFGTFYLRRFHRILPLYVISVAIFFTGVAVVARTGPGYLHRLFNSVLPLWSYPLFVQNIFAAVRQRWGAEWMSATWSLALEEQFYLLLPLLIRVLNRKWIVRLTVAAIVCAPLFRLALVLHGNDQYAPYTLLPSRADSLGLGVLIAIACRNRAVWDWLIAHRAALRLVCAGFAAGLLVFVVRQTPGFVSFVGYSWFGGYYATLMILLLVNPGRPLRILFGNRILARLGNYSYAIYVLHYGIFGLCHYAFFHAAPDVHDLPTLAVTLLALAITLVLAAASWRFLERPLIRRGHERYRYAQPDRSTYSTAPAAGMNAHV